MKELDDYLAARKALFALANVPDEGQRLIDHRSKRWRDHMEYISTIGTPITADTFTGELHRTETVTFLSKKGNCRLYIFDNAKEVK